MQYRTALQLFSDRLKAVLGEKIKDIILYGSAARGELREDSDLDVAVVIDGDERAVLDIICSIVVEVLLETGDYISVQILSENDLGREYTPFIRNILAEGISIV